MSFINGKLAYDGQLQTGYPTTWARHESGPSPGEEWSGTCISASYLNPIIEMAAEKPAQTGKSCYGVILVYTANRYIPDSTLTMTAPLSRARIGYGFAMRQLVKKAAVGSDQA